MMLTLLYVTSLASLAFCSSSSESSSLSQAGVASRGRNSHSPSSRDDPNTLQRKTLSTQSSLLDLDTSLILRAYGKSLEEGTHYEIDGEEVASETFSVVLLEKFGMEMDVIRLNFDDFQAKKTNFYVQFVWKTFPIAVLSVVWEGNGSDGNIVSEFFGCKVREICDEEIPKILQGRSPLVRTTSENIINFWTSYIFKHVQDEYISQLQKWEESESADRKCSLKSMKEVGLKVDDSSGATMTAVTMDFVSKKIRTSNVGNSPAWYEYEAKGSRAKGSQTKGSQAKEFKDKSIYTDHSISNELSAICRKRKGLDLMSIRWPTTRRQPFARLVLSDASQRRIDVRFRYPPNNGFEPQLGNSVLGRSLGHSSQKGPLSSKPTTSVGRCPNRMCPLVVVGSASINRAVGRHPNIHAAEKNPAVEGLLEMRQICSRVSEETKTKCSKLLCNILDGDANWHKKRRNVITSQLFSLLRSSNESLRDYLADQSKNSQDSVVAVILRSKD